MKRPGEYAAELHEWLSATGARSKELPSGIIVGPSGFDLPSVGGLERILDTAFFASLTQEEGRPVRFTIFFLGTVGSFQFSRFATAEELSPKTLRKLGPAIDPWRAAFVVKEISGELKIVGLAEMAAGGFGSSKVLLTAMGVRVVGTGVLQITYGPAAAALYPGSKPHLDVDEAQSVRQFAERFHSPITDLMVQTVFRLLRAVRRLGHGGTVLLLSSENTTLSEVSDGRRFAPADPTLAESLQRLNAPSHVMLPGPLPNEPAECLLRERGQNSARFRLCRAIEFVAALSAVDGAVVLERDLSVRSFGSFFETTTLPARVDRMSPSGGMEPIERLESRYGARHQSACRWAAAHPDEGTALVVSKDGEAHMVVGEKGQRAVLFGPIFMSDDPDDV